MYSGYSLVDEKAIVGGHVKLIFGFHFAKTPCKPSASVLVYELDDGALIGALIDIDVRRNGLFTRDG